jgi:DNA gyrase/topoisomerase IV subunit A
MAQPRLTEYLLKLATDASTLERFRKANQSEREALMKAAGLSDVQREAVLSGVSRRITEQVAEELRKESSTGSHGGGVGEVIHLQISVQLAPPPR